MCIQNNVKQFGNLVVEYDVMLTLIFAVHELRKIEMLKKFSV